MANPNSSKNYKWFSNKALMNLSLHRLRRPKKPPQMMEHAQDCFREVFLRYDADGDGRISSEELRSFLAWAGDVLSKEEVAELVRDLDSDGDGFIDYEEFVRLVGNGRRYGGGGGAEGDNEEDLRRAFQMFEGVEKSGCITPSGLQRVLESLGERRTEEECTSMIRAYDLDGNGVLDYHEFLRMMG
ncbi:putative calcium-binding protein CML41 [Platanthera guangdongensis]|uniref:Calcium-binding protein CML41 n=1 Tax=Platanthera guangdongensis TaxID=2320717 RepID=A0ABR2MAJ1_9ASPA